MTIAALAIVSYDNSNNMPHQNFHQVNFHQVTFAYNYPSQYFHQPPLQRITAMTIAAPCFCCCSNSYLRFFSDFYFPFYSSSPSRFISRYDNSYNPHHQHNLSHLELLAFICSSSSPLASTTVALQGRVENVVPTSPHL